MEAKQYLACTKFCCSGTTEYAFEQYTTVKSYSIYSEHRKDAHQCTVDSSLYVKQTKYLSYTHGAAAALLALYLPTPSISLTANKCQPE
jgi:hypothetical protein